MHFMHAHRINIFHKKDKIDFFPIDKLSKFYIYNIVYFFTLKNDRIFLVKSSCADGDIDDGKRTSVNLA